MAVSNIEPCKSRGKSCRCAAFFQLKSAAVVHAAGGGSGVARPRLDSRTRRTPASAALEASLVATSPFFHTTYHECNFDEVRLKCDACACYIESHAHARSPLLIGTITGASEHRSSTRAPRFALTLASRQNRFEKHLGLSAQRNDGKRCALLCHLRPIARTAPACAFPSPPSRFVLFLSLFALALFMRRLCLLVCSFVGTSAKQAAAPMDSTERPPVRGRIHARARPTDRPTDRPTTGRSVCVLANALT